ncbi:hypothetical protein [Burkholderia ubonensis]|uniref:hypothetical protein n=1 Tax=Burkholderia ubonensis TaxID=101571 RepID=UPI0008FDC684|nr:hypothetical protein [Burkholderia ubonensis]OJB05017.1 hypothetical protein BGV48_17070 [Burkholderia ubonensis]
MTALDAHLNALGRRALGSPKLAWHYTRAKHLRGIIDTGELRPAFPYLPHATDEYLARHHARKVIFFTVNQNWEPSIGPFTGTMTIEELLTDSGGGWVRFGYREDRLFQIANFPEIFARDKWLPDSLRGSYLSNAVRDWRISLVPIRIVDMSAIDTLDEETGFTSWKRVWVQDGDANKLGPVKRGKLNRKGAEEFFQRFQELANMPQVAQPIEETANEGRS